MWSDGAFQIHPDDNTLFSESLYSSWVVNGVSALENGACVGGICSYPNTIAVREFASQATRTA